MVEPADELQVVFEKAIADAQKLGLIRNFRTSLALCCSDNFAQILDGYGCILKFERRITGLFTNKFMRLR